MEDSWKELISWGLNYAPISIWDFLSVFSVIWNDRLVESLVLVVAFWSVSACLSSLSAIYWSVGSLFGWLSVLEHHYDFGWSYYLLLDFTIGGGWGGFPRPHKIKLWKKGGWGPPFLYRPTLQWCSSTDIGWLDILVYSYKLLGLGLELIVHFTTGNGFYFRKPEIKKGDWGSIT